MQRILIFWGITALIFHLTSCGGVATLETDLEQLAQEFQHLDCKQAMLAKETRKTWDGVVERLDAQLPVDMPPAEKNNMLTVRNASLIRMFETYQELPDSVQQLVSQAEKKDNEIVAALNDIKQERSVLETKKRALFLTLEEKKPNEIHHYRKHFDTLRNTPCQ